MGFLQTTGGANKPVQDRVGAENGNVVFDPAAPAPITITPSVPYSCASLVNCSECFVRGTIVPVDAATFDGDGTFIIPPYGTHSFGFDDEDQIQDIILEVVDAPTAAGAGNATAFTPKTAVPSGVGPLVTVNFLEE